MHGVMGKPPGAATDNNGVATSKIMLLMLVAMTGVAPISLYMLVPALPLLATTFGRDIGVAQMTVSLFMVGIACSQIIMGPLSDRFGRRRHGGEPRHHPRSLQPRPHQLHDQPGDRGHDDRADAEPADRRPFGNRV